MTYGDLDINLSKNLTKYFLNDFKRAFFCFFRVALRRQGGELGGRGVDELSLPAVEVSEYRPNVV